jgi:RHS repeat-associated protein
MVLTDISSAPFRTSLRNLLLLTALSFVLICGLRGICGAQNVDTGAGFPPFIAVAGGPFDSVNLPYGNVHMEFPVRSKAGKYPLSYNLTGNSHAYIALRPTYSNPYNQWFVSSGVGGIVSGSPLANGLYTGTGFTTVQTIECGTSFNGLESGWFVTDPQGTVHPFSPNMTIANGGLCGPTTNSGVTTDGSGYSIQLVTGSVGQGYIPQVTLWDKEGNLIQVPRAQLPPSCDGTLDCATDPDQISMTVGPTGTVLDTLGETVVTVSDNVNQQGGTVTYAYNDVSQNSQPVTVNFSPVFYVSDFGCQGVQEMPAMDGTIETSVVYPDGEKVNFGYEKTPLSSWQPGYSYGFFGFINLYGVVIVDSNGNAEQVVTAGTSGTGQPNWNTSIGGYTHDGTVVWQNMGSSWTNGRVTSITYPQGGSVTYSYSGMTCTFGSPGGNGSTAVGFGWVNQIKRTVNDNNGHSSTWTYQITPPSGGGGSLTVTETDPLNNVTTLVYAGATQTGSGVNSACVNGYSGGCQYSYVQTEKLSYNGAAIPGNLIGKQVTCYNGINSNEAGCVTRSIPIYFPITQTDVYTHAIGSTGTIGAQNDVQTVLDGYGNVTSIKNYDYGAAFPPTGTPLSTTTTVYDTSGACGTLSIAAMQDRPCSVTVTGSSGGSQVSYTYNSAGHATQTSTLISGSNSLVSKATFNPNGTIATVTDVNNQTTNYYYNGPGGCSNLLLTSAVLPVDSLTSSQTWNCSGGVLASSTDANSRITQYGFVDANGHADPLWRRRSVTDPLNNVTWTNPSPGGTLPATVETTLTFNNGLSAVDNLTTFDGLGRPIYQQTREAPNTQNFDTVVTMYDTLGRVASVGIPCLSTAASMPCSSPKTTTTYDALNRPLQVTDGGQGYTTYTYNLNDVLVTLGPAPTVPLTENTKQRQYEYDGMGRLTSVCEITAGTSAWPGGNCAQKSANTGYWTRYAYDALSRLTTVNQNIQGTAQTRNYQYDGLNRLTSEKNPEWGPGTATYTYDSDSGGICPTSRGDMVKRLDAMGNTTCYTYDGIHRLLTTTYSSGLYASVTPSKTFVYDTTSFTCSDPTGPNVLGRLSEAFTGSTSDKITDLAFCYSPRGEPTDEYESTPNSGSYYHVPVTYWANGQSEAVGPFLNEAMVSITPDGEGRPLTITGGAGNIMYNPASQPTQLMVSCAAICYPITYTYDPNTIRMTQYSFAGSNGTLSGTLTWNPNGSLQQLVVADPVNSADAQTCTYSADDLSRLASVSCNSGATWGQQFTYDPFGNITKTVPSGATGVSWIPGYNTSTNHYSLGGTSYDSNGNVLKDSFNTYAWDAEGKQLSTNYGGEETFGFTYDAFGHMVELAVNGTYTRSYLNMGKFRFSATGQTAGYSETPLPGGSIASQNNGDTGIQIADWLGTIRGNSNYTGGIVNSTGARAPFGEGYAGAPPEAFTGQDSDGNRSNPIYWFPERQYVATQGRWISPDPAGAAAVDLSNPQSWNRYAYALNNPLRYIDPLGLYCQWDDGTQDDPEFDGGAGFGDCEDQGGTWIDTVTITVNGNSPDDVDTIENGEQIFPQIVQSQQSYVNCVKNAGNYFSLQHGLQAASGGRLGNSWLSGALLGNPFSDLIAFGQGLASRNGAEAGSSGSSAALGFYDPAGRTLEAATQLQDVTLVTTSVTATSVTLPGASVTSVSLNATSQTIPLSTLGTIAKPFLAVAKGLNVWNYGVTSFAGFVCGIGR